MALFAINAHNISTKVESVHIRATQFDIQQHMANKLVEIHVHDY